MSDRPVYYKCVLRPTLWWMGNETNAKHYLCQMKDKSYRIRGIGGIKHDMKFRFYEDEIEAIRAMHPEFDMLFKIQETRIYNYRGEE